MPVERCRVALTFGGQKQYYCRETEIKKRGDWVVQPYIDVYPEHAAVMSEVVARILVERLRSLCGQDVHIEDCKDGRRIDIGQEAPPPAEDDRVPMVATLDLQKWYYVKPIARPEGRKWMLRCDPPGVQPQLIYADDPIACVSKANDMRFLPWAQEAPAPEKPAVPVAPSATQIKPVVTIRPGNRR